MSPTSDVADDAIIVRRTNYGDSDLIVGLYTRQLGLISAMARSARRSRRRFGGALNLFVRIQPELTRRKSSELWSFASAQVIEDFSALAHDVACFAHASYATELARELAPPEQPDAAVLELVLELYRSVLEVGAQPATLRAFELSLLGLHGIAPEFAACPRCASAVSSSWVFDPDQGGALCAECAAHTRGPRTRLISSELRDYLLALSALSGLSGLSGLTSARDIAAPQVIQLEARDLLVSEVLAHTGRMLRSLDFVRQLGGGR